MNAREGPTSSGKGPRPAKEASIALTFLLSTLSVCGGRTA